ncbi:MAG TPA: glucan biosynthesis protein [Steroidobacteraceae bacterium]|nr:glucan biosynthesis protein [Steroidobacteraceae bacterium]
MRVSIGKSIGMLTLVAALQGHAAHARAPAKPPPKPAPKPAANYPFTFDTLLEEAKRRAAASYSPQRNSVPSALDKLSPEQYRSIHFNSDAGIWRAEKLPFRLELLRAAPNLPTVTLSTVENGIAKDVVATTAMFQISGTTPAQLGNVPVPLSGFRVRSLINSNKVWDEFLVFQGGSYFRAVAKNLLYGLSARGLAIDTGEPAGEEFPAFTHFWIERPGPKANALVIYALLESKSTTGAYKITAQPGVETQTEVELTLFPRAEMRVVGIAPLTSMFLFDETNRGRLDDYRPEVHDSDGLQIATKSGEQLFRPLANPLKLQVSSFTTQVPQGFGLVQRSRQQSDFEDFDAQYERRPSAWITPKGDWGAGAVELVEIPSGRETNDNIVAFWRPSQALPPGRPVHFAYNITWNDEPPLPKGMGRVIATRSGASIDRKRRVFLLDIVGAGEKLDGLRLELSSSAGAISNSTLVANSELHGLRASFEIDPKDAEVIEMRLRVMRGDTPVSETWLYRWTSG